MDCLYLDFQKAFDKCDIFMAAHAIKKAGIQGQLGIWILDFMSGRTQYVLVNNKLSRGEKVLSGVPQGSILGPIVFIIAIQSLAELDLDGIVEMFADDTKDSIIITNENDAEKLQSDLVKLNKWTTTFGMTFNSDKFQCLKSGPNFEIKTQYTYFSPDLESPIEDKDIVKDLGIYLSSDGLFNNHIKEIVKKVRKRCGWIHRAFNMNNVTFRRFLWRTYVIGIIDYGSQLWCPIDISLMAELEGLQRT